MLVDDCETAAMPIVLFLSEGVFKLRIAKAESRRAASRRHCMLRDKQAARVGSEKLQKACRIVQSEIDTRELYAPSDSCPLYPW